MVVVLAAIAPVIAVAGVLLARANDRSSTPPDLPAVAIDPSSTGGRTPLPGFGQVLVEVTAADGSTCEACLLLAETQEQRARGLMEVTDASLGGYDGMLFDYGGETRTGGFWMRNTRIPLDAVFLDVDGRYIDSLPMVPCPDSVADDDCPRYGPDEPFGTVIELAALEPADLLLAEGSNVEVVGSDCPLELAGRG